MSKTSKEKIRGSVKPEEIKEEIVGSNSRSFVCSPYEDIAEEVVEVEDDSMFVENRQFRCRSGKKQGDDDAEVTEDLEEPEVSEKNTKEPEYVEMITFDVPHVTLRRPKTVR